MSVFDPSRDFEAGNAFLLAVLGLVSTSEQVASAVARLAPAPNDEALAPLSERDRDDPVLHALLGAIRLALLTGSTATTWAVEEDGEAEGAVAQTTVELIPTWELLR